MPGWVVVGTIVISMISAYGFLTLRCRGMGNPFGRHARWWAIAIILLTALISTAVGLAAVAAGNHALAAFVGLILPSGIWLGRAAALDSRPRASQWRRQLVTWAASPLRRLDDAMGDDMQAWCDARVRAAARQPQWLSDAALYYYSQVGRRVKDNRARDELKGWRESIAHKVTLVRLINLDTTDTRLHATLGSHPSTMDSRRYSADDRPRLARRLVADAENELNMFLASVYRLGYHRLLIYPFRPPPVPREKTKPGRSAKPRPASG